MPERSILRPGPVVARVVLWGLGGATLALALSFVLRSRFLATAGTTIVSEKSMDSALRLAGFAAQLGVSGALPTSSDSPELFAAVARGRQVARLALADTVCLPKSGCEAVAAAVHAPADTSRAAIQKRLKALGKRLSVSVDAKTGVIQFSAWADSPEAAEGVLRTVLRALNEVVVTRRESQARNERVSAEARFKDLDRRRGAVEDTLTGFYEANRSFQLSPRLAFRERQLSRQLEFWQTLATGVARDAETARLDEVRDVPVMTVVEAPFASPRKVFPKRLAFAAAGLLLGALLGVPRREWRAAWGALVKPER